MFRGEAITLGVVLSLEIFGVLDHALDLSLAETAIGVVVGDRVLQKSEVNIKKQLFRLKQTWLPVDFSRAVTFRMLLASISKVTSI